MNRVSLVNRMLSTGRSHWSAQVETIELEGRQVRLTGLKVRHTDQTEPVFQAASAITNASWIDLKSGQLGDVVVDSPALFWRSGLQSDPSQPKKSPAPVVSWRSLKVISGQLDLDSKDSFRASGEVSGQTGEGTYWNDGRVEVRDGVLDFNNPFFEFLLETGPVSLVKIQADGLTVKGQLEADGGRLTLDGGALVATKIEVTPRLLSSPQVTKSAAIELPTGDAGGQNVVHSVTVTNLTAPAVDLHVATPWKIAAATDLAAERFLYQSGRPVTGQGIQLSNSSLTLAGILHLPLFRIQGNITPSGPQISRLNLADAEVTDLNQLLEKFGLPAEFRPAGSLRMNADLSDLEFADGRIQSRSVQKITVSGVHLTFPDQTIIKTEKLTLEGVPEEIIQDRRLRLVDIDSLDITAVPASTAKVAFSASPGKSGPEPSDRPAWEGWSPDTLTITNGRMEVRLPAPAPVTFLSAFAAQTSEDGTGQGRRWQVSLTDPKLVHADFPDRPVASAAAVTLTADPDRFWRQRELDSLTFQDAALNVGEALFQWVKSIPPPSDSNSELVAGQTAAPFPVDPPWRLKQLVFDGSLVSLEDIGDGRRLEIPVSHQEFQDLPLDTTALSMVERVYKIEVPNITLYSPFGEGQKVAVLDTNYIQFTPSGLLANRLERVDLMLPSLYAGQPLFDFVDAARRTFAALAALPAATPKPLLASNAPGNSTLLSAMASVQPAPARPSNWHIPFFTESGRVIVAPKGFPWPNVPAIPFRNARGPDGKPTPFLLDGESFHGELAVEPGWYEFPEYKLRLRISDRGRIVFNTPQAESDNNLVEVFEKNTVIFRQLRIDDVWLAVTYDDKGIYARFGGNTCGGTITGQFNLYLDELYTWDGWASLSDVRMKPLTDKLSPDSFRMVGPIDELTVKAVGDITSLYQATLDLKVTKPGRLEILALDGLKESIEKMGGISADLGKISVGTLRDFDYTGCTGSLRLFGTEGEGRLALTGPAGSRTFQLHLHDYRGRVPAASIPF